MTSHDFVVFGLQITAMLACAVVCGQLMRRIGQPAVLGEMIGGIVLGPTLFGTLAPEAYSALFPSFAPAVNIAREATIKLGMLFFLFITGLEIDLGDLKRLGKQAASIGLVGTLVPIAVGVALVYALPVAFWGGKAAAHLMPFALFIGMNLGNSANPVLARILMDLKLLKTDIGALIMTSTVVDELVTWTLFAMLLNQVAPTGGSHGGPMNLGMWVINLVLFVGGVLLIGRWLTRKLFHWVKKQVSWPTGFIAATTVAVLLASCVAEKIGIHAFFGAFLVGVAFGGDSDDKEKKEVRELIANFALSFFAPIYFVSLGLTADFVKEFDWMLVGFITAAAFASKIGAVLLGAKLAGMPLDRKAWAIGFGLNARGATGIILAGVGLEYGLIDRRLFVAMVVMALITSMLSGPVLQKLLKKT